MNDDFLSFFLLYISGVISLWLVQVIYRDDFFSTFFTRLVASSVYLGIAVAIQLGWKYLHSHLHGEWIIIPSLLAIFIPGYASYFSFLLCNKFLPCFDFTNHRQIIRCSLVFFGFNFIGFLIILTFQVFGIFIFSGGGYYTARRRSSFYYQDWFYDRYFD